jgi:quinol monooxygenase YgiN
MLRHVVLMRFDPEAGDRARQALIDGLRALPAQIDGITTYEVGMDAGLRDTPWDLGVVALFEDEAAWRAYLDHPAHVAVVKNLIPPAVIDRTSLQMTV